MRTAVVFAAVVMVTLVAFLTQGITAQEFSIPDREAVATLAAHIWKVARASQGTTVGLPHKRNSELINSLLGINKMMNEAGRR
ncbi:pigment-dispersing hormone 2 peptides-like [Eriocheir sinensis]|uniref:pigment-dispersing hormone 2 peptides-like n=1 Tax=Eriocheir sinensis TaxID=95602 RepID=UPI0021C5B776|nr:pigment-dispersing hormone 2 peptides-like [Eriocheir sinensis]